MLSLFAWQKSNTEKVKIANKIVDRKLLPTPWVLGLPDCTSLAREEVLFQGAMNEIMGHPRRVPDGCL